MTKKTFVNSKFLSLWCGWPRRL